MIELVSTISGSSSIATNPPASAPWLEDDVPGDEADEEPAAEEPDVPDGRFDDVPEEDPADEAEELLPLPEVALSLATAASDAAESVSVSMVGDPPAYAENAATDVSRKAIERTELRISKPLIFS